MHVLPELIPATLDRPQLHSRKHHHIYNGSGRLPIFTWVRSPTIIALEPDEPGHCQIDHVLVYEIILYFGNNRACTIYRSRADFEKLRKTLSPWKRGPPSSIPRDHNDVAVLHQLLNDAIIHRPQDCALEYFLRRRMEDCGGQLC